MNNFETPKLESSCAKIIKKNKTKWKGNLDKRSDWLQHHFNKLFCAINHLHNVTTCSNTCRKEH